MSGNINISLLKLRYRLGRTLRKLAGREKYVHMTSLTGFYKRVWEEAAREIAANFTEIAEGYWKIEKGPCETFINNYVVPIDDPVVLNVAGNKSLSYRLLEEKGLPVPANSSFNIREMEVAERFMARHAGSYFVIKPSNGTSGARGITTHVRTREECLKASVLASLFSEEIIIERLIPGESYRLLVLDGRMILASKRKGLWLEGDGRSDVIALLDRGGIKTCGNDRDMDATLKAQGLTPGSIAEKGRRFLTKSLKNTNFSEFRTVYDEDATRLIGPCLRQEAQLAAEALGSRFAGVDIVTTDPSVPLSKSKGAIVEINTTPGLHHHYNLSGYKPAVSPAVLVLNYLLDLKHIEKGGAPCM